MKNKKQLTMDFKLRYYNGISEDIEEDDIEDLDMDNLLLNTAQGSMRNNQQSNSSLNDNGEQRSLRERRSAEQSSSNQQGNQSSNGYGKGSEESALPVSVKSNVSECKIDKLTFNQLSLLYGNQSVLDLPLMLYEDGEDTFLVYKCKDSVLHACNVLTSKLTDSDLSNFKTITRIDKTEFDKFNIDTKQLSI